MISTGKMFFVNLRSGLDMPGQLFIYVSAPFTRKVGSNFSTPKCVCVRARCLHMHTLFSFASSIFFSVTKFNSGIWQRAVMGQSFNLEHC